MFLEGSNIAGIKHSPGLPNIKAQLHLMGSNTDMGIMYFSYKNGHGGAQGYEWNTSMGDNVYMIDVSRMNSIYGASETVQPKAITVKYFIKAK